MSCGKLRIARDQHQFGPSGRRYAENDTVLDVFSRYALPVALSTCLAVIASGCGGDSSHPLPHTQALVEPAQISRAGHKSPKGVLLKLWRAVQVGDAASAAGFYDQRVLQAIGFGRVSGSLAQQRSHLEVLRPTNVTVSRTALGLEAVVEGENTVQGTRENKTEVFSFLLRRNPEGWRVAYDTLLGDALAGYVYSLVQERVAPGSNTPSPQAQIAARQIGDLYRGLSSPKAEQPKQRKNASIR
jgi:hypothetical protein